MHEDSKPHQAPGTASPFHHFKKLQEYDKHLNVYISENVFVFLLRLYICIYLIVLTTTMMRHFIVVTKSKEDEMFENLSSAPIVYIYEDPQ